MSTRSKGTSRAKPQLPNGGWTPEKEAAWQSGQPLPIQHGDFVVWTYSYKVGGIVIGEGELQAGRMSIPAWRVWNDLSGAEQLIPKDAAELSGY